MRHAQGIFNTDDTDLLTGRADKSDLWDADSVVDTRIADRLLLRRDLLATVRAGAITRAELKSSKANPAIC